MQLGNHLKSNKPLEELQRLLFNHLVVQSSSNFSSRMVTLEIKKQFLRRKEQLLNGKKDGKLDFNSNVSQVNDIDQIQAQLSRDEKENFDPLQQSGRTILKAKSQRRSEQILTERFDDQRHEMLINRRILGASYVRP